MRALNGDRRCPSHLAVVPFLAKRNSDPLAKRIGEDPHSPSGFLASSPTDELNPEEALMVRQEEEYMETLVAEIEALFENDEQAQLILDGAMNGLSAEEIRESGALDRSTYNTARKRIRRRIDKKYPNGWDR